tara:strand:+ start:977 stop:1159 length:183 start_codon:yes stop_codon:yes gene_type:complete
MPRYFSTMPGNPREWFNMTVEERRLYKAACNERGGRINAGQYIVPKVIDIYNAMARKANK